MIRLSSEIWLPGLSLQGKFNLRPEVISSIQHLSELPFPILSETTSIGVIYVVLSSRTEFWACKIFAEGECLNSISWAYHKVCDSFLFIEKALICSYD